MGRLTTRRRITRLQRTDTGVSSRPRNDVLAAEEPLELRVGGQTLTVTMRTPGHDFELAAGLLVSEGLVSTAEQLRSMRYCSGTDELGQQTYNVIDLDLDPALVQAALSTRRHLMTSSACGICGTTSIHAVHKALPEHPPKPQLSISAETLLQLPDTLRANQDLFASTGGVHAAGLFSGTGELLQLREDVGRHNAVDKVVGACLLNGRLPLTGTAVQVSGRASFELVQKAALAGVELLSAVGAPSSLAAELAETAGITLAGFSRGNSLNIYTHPHRVRL
ncbi:formate dehydrogenase accessory sulfurtransferase FdhD [Nesterenkonia alkaliphila]|uniref:Sulfur carrier protein FdhD n=1 Tax=Nesterenkonia alkaliphila TaxID=1463631 RepID=A0A7K1ULB0_9MICC|nr:formate dehydrogenase accessory sulfurtransferase FdhD [Nesterenkonia alkaliphila]MVT27260.1 formate dehydrogenase accessory sulfurtransferase FdhD [Nesterenkonia alkaliphila]GFZ78239.1 sulfurtransferase FdhD [Nesterenkonia alkaliphila]